MVPGEDAVITATVDGSGHARACATCCSTRPWARSVVGGRAPEPTGDGQLHGDHPGRRHRRRSSRASTSSTWPPVQRLRWRSSPSAGSTWRCCRSASHGLVAAAPHPRPCRQPGRGALVVLVLLVLTLGATGYSDRILERPGGRGAARRCARASRRPSATPTRSRTTVEARRAELESAYGLDRAWYERLPGDGRPRCSSSTSARRAPSAPPSGSNGVGDIIARAAAAHDPAADDLAAHHGRHRPGSGRLALDAARLARRPRRVSYVAAITNGLPGLVGGHPAHPHLLVLAAHPALGRHVQHAATGGRPGVLPATCCGTRCCPS